MKFEHIKTKPPYVLAGGFLFIILIGTLLLELPFAHHKSISWLHALFTSTSAVTVTGLSVEDTANFTLFGQVVLMCLIQIGGLGFMTFAIYIARRMGAELAYSAMQLLKKHWVMCLLIYFYILPKTF